MAFARQSRLALKSRESVKSRKARQSRRAKTSRESGLLGRPRRAAKHAEPRTGARAHGQEG